MGNCPLDGCEGMTCIIEFADRSEHQTGKTTALLAVLSEQGLREPGSAYYVAPTQAQAQWVGKMRPVPGVLIVPWSYIKDVPRPDAKFIGIDDFDSVTDPLKYEVLNELHWRLRLHNGPTKLLIVG